MNGSFLGRVSSLFVRGEDFVVFEIFRDHLRAAFLKIDREEKEITVLKISHHEISSLAEAGTLIKRFGKLKRKKIIVALGPHLATTIYSSISLIREQPKTVIEEAELDNLVSQAIWKFFDRRRSAIAKKMVVEDLDLIFTDARIQGIRLDGHKVVNPLGFKARSLRVAFSQTFLTRECSDLIKEILPLNQIVLIGEAGALIANVVAPDSPQDKFLVPIISLNHTDIFLVDDKERSFWDVFPWGFENLVRFVSENLAVSDTVARKIIDQYMNGETSDLFSKRFEQLLMEEFGALISGLVLALKRTKTSVMLVHTRVIFPSFLFGSSFVRRFQQKVHMRPITPDSVSENFGFAIQYKNPEDAPHALPLPFYFLEWQLSPRHSKLEQSAMRRVRWLSPLSSKSGPQDMQ